MIAETIYKKKERIPNESRQYIGFGFMILESKSK